MPATKKKRKSTRPAHLVALQPFEPAQTLSEVMDAWRGMENKLKQSLPRLAASESFEACLQNSWLATGLEFCREDLEAYVERTKDALDIPLSFDERLALIERAGAKGISAYIRGMLGLSEEPNQSPEPTAMSVTPPAAQEARQP